MGRGHTLLPQIRLQVEPGILPSFVTGKHLVISQPCERVVATLVGAGTCQRAQACVTASEEPRFRYVLAHYASGDVDQTSLELTKQVLYEWFQPGHSVSWLLQ